MLSAVVLSGGGAEGDFELGAVQCMYGMGISPDILTGTSVGSINATKLAEGDAALAGLSRIWYGLNSTSDFMQAEPWFTTLSGDVQQLFSLSLTTVIADLVFTLTNPFAFVINADSIGVDIAHLIDAVNEAQVSRSIYNIDPVMGLVRTNISPDLVRSSGKILRLAMVSLDSGDTRYVDEQGTFIDGQGGDPPDLFTAIQASCSIPAIYPAVSFGGQTYIDGGVRHVLPIAAAVDAGAVTVYAVSASALEVGSEPPYDGANLVRIATRAVEGIMTVQIGQSEAYPAGNGWGAFVQIISPAVYVNIHDSFTTDPPLVRIRIDYGYMSAGAVINPDFDEDAGVVQGTTNEVALLRRLNVLDERALTNLTGPPPPAPNNNPLTSARQRMLTLRQMIIDMQRRLADFPVGASAYWTDWEDNPNPGTASTPWEEFDGTWADTSTDPPTANPFVVPAAPLPPGLTQGNQFLEFLKEPDPAAWQVNDSSNDPGIEASPPVRGNFAALFDSSDNTLHAFVRGMDGTLIDFHKGPDPAPWQAGIHIDRPRILGSPSAVLDPSSGVLHVFARGLDGSLLDFQNGPASWQVTNHSSDPAIARLRISSNPAAVSDPNDAALHVFARGVDGSLLDFSNPHGLWRARNISNLPGIGGVRISGNPTAVVDASRNMVRVFACSMSYSFALLEFGKGTGPWQFGSDPGGTGTQIVSPFALFDSARNVLHVFARDWRDNSLVHFFVGPDPALWQVETPVPGIEIQGRPGAALDSSGTILQVFARRQDGSLLEFFKALDSVAAWQSADRSSDPALQAVRVAGSPLPASDLPGFGTSLHVFATSSDLDF
jgi:predicted acylesterase/phospholipase RssA